MFLAVEEIEAIPVSKLSVLRRKEVLRLVTARWKMLHSPIHAAGHALDPQFINTDIHSNEEVRFHGFSHLHAAAPWLLCYLCTMFCVHGVINDALRNNHLVRHN